MLSTIPLSEAAARGGLTGLLLLAAPFLLGADDAYLREIEEEAKRQATMLTVNPAPPRLATPDVSPTEAATDRLASGLDQAAFAQALRETLPGTYALYQQFDPPRKQQVYEAYRSDNRLAGISERVIHLLSAKP
jgi:hypothetical protein